MEKYGLPTDKLFCELKVLEEKSKIEFIQETTEPVSTKLPEEKYMEWPYKQKKLF